MQLAFRECGLASTFTKKELAMNARSVSLLCAALAAAGIAHADDFRDRASFALFAGGNAAMPGSFRGQTVPYQINDPSGSIVYHDLKFDDAYDHQYTYGGEFDYAFNPSLTGFGRIGYANFDGREQHVGTFTSAATELSPVKASFEDTNTREFDLGARYNFMPGSKWQPFVGAALGATHLSAAKADFPNLDGSGKTRVTLGESDTVFSQRVETGLQFAPMRNFDLRLSAAANHLDTDTKSSDPNLALVGLKDLSGEERNHWDYPVELAAVWNFGG
jgi:hypothetical protein